LDLYGREVIGWAMGERMTKELVMNCLNQANKRRNNPKGVLAHSDRGSQVRRGLSEATGEIRSHLLNEPKGECLGQRSNGKFLEQTEAGMAE